MPPEQEEVHIWSIYLEQDSAKCPLFEAMLPEDEIRRAERFRLPELRNRFIAIRAILRFLLGDYLCCNPANIRFLYGKYGKPELSDKGKLHFNLSHTDNWLMIAVSKCCEVGIDIVAKAPLSDIDGLARLIFTTEEQNQLASLHATERLDAFYRGWARKEAYVKALGNSIARHAGVFSVSLNPYEKKGQVIGNGLTKVHLTDIEAPEGYNASLAYKGKTRNVKMLSAFRVTNSIPEWS